VELRGDVAHPGLLAEVREAHAAGAEGDDAVDGGVRRGAVEVRRAGRGEGQSPARCSRGYTSPKASPVKTVSRAGSCTTKWWLAWPRVWMKRSTPRAEGDLRAVVEARTREASMPRMVP
jgi:hypothetical protein